jgi:hypothetical protein
MPNDYVNVDECTFVRMSNEVQVLSFDGDNICTVSLDWSDDQIRTMLHLANSIFRTGYYMGRKHKAREFRQLLEEGLEKVNES